MVKKKEVYTFLFTNILLRLQTLGNGNLYPHFQKSFGFDQA